MTPWTLPSLPSFACPCQNHHVYAWTRRRNKLERLFPSSVSCAPSLRSWYSCLGDQPSWLAFVGCKCCGSTRAAHRGSVTTGTFPFESIEWTFWIHLSIRRLYPHIHTGIRLRGFLSIILDIISYVHQERKVVRGCIWIPTSHHCTYHFRVHLLSNERSIQTWTW